MTDTLYSATTGYGWDSGEGLSAVDQGIHNALDRDFEKSSVPRAFSVDVPSGVYEVWFLLSNSGQDVPSMSVTIEGETYPLESVWITSQWLAGESLAASAGYPTADYRFGIQVNDSRLDIAFASVSTSWQINALAITRQSNQFENYRSYEVAVSNEHTAPKVEFLPVYTVPSRFWWVSDLLRDYDADWAYVERWRDSIVTSTMTPADKFRAVATVISTFSASWSPSNHPVDVINAGNGSCTGVANLMTMVAWSLGLPARNLILYADSGLRMGLYPLSDPYNTTLGLGRAHEISEVFLDGEWRAFDTGLDLGTDFAKFRSFTTWTGTIPEYQIYSARSVLYHGWDGSSNWDSLYSPSTASLIYPGYADQEYRLSTHDPRRPRSLRIDEVVTFGGSPVQIVPGNSALRKTFWLSPLRPDVRRVVTRVPFTIDYGGTPLVSDWYLKVNGREHILGKANTDWGANAGQMLEVEIPFAELVTGWNTLEIGARSSSSEEGLWVNTSGEKTNSRAFVKCCGKSLPGNSTALGC